MYVSLYFRYNGYNMGITGITTCRWGHRGTETLWCWTRGSGGHCQSGSPTSFEKLPVGLGIFFLKFVFFGLVFIGKFGLKSTSYILLHVDLRFKIWSIWSEIIQSIYISLLDSMVTPWPHALLRGNDNAWIELNIQLLQVGTCSYHAVCLWCLGLQGNSWTTPYSTRKLSSWFGYHEWIPELPSLPGALFPPGDGAWTPRNAFGSWYLWWWRFPRGASPVEDGSWGSHIEDG